MANALGQRRQHIHAEAAGYSVEALRLAEATQHAYTVGMAHNAAHMLNLLKSEWAKARPLSEHGIAVLRPGNVRLLPSAIAASAWPWPSSARRARRSTIREGQELREREEVRALVGNRGVRDNFLGRASLLLGRIDEARSLAERVVENSSRHRGWAAHALQLLGDIATHPDRFDAESGEACYRQALALAEPRGMRPLIAHCHLGLGKLYRRTGEPDQAQEHLTTATTMYREMDMAFWLEQAAAEMKGLEG